MNNRLDDSVGSTSPRGFRFEIIFASLLLAFGLFGLPALIYLVGATLLGPYLESEAPANAMAAFYRNFFADLAAPTLRAWLIAIGPLAVIVLFRLAFLGHRGGDAEPPAPPPRRERERDREAPARRAAPAPSRQPARSPQPSGRGGRRVEPRIGGD